MKSNKFKIPKKLVLLGQTFNIKFVKRVDINDENCFATINFKKRIIKVSIKIKDDRTYLEGVLFHELGHYFANYYNIEDGEIFAEAFSKFIVNIINQIGYKKE